MEKAQTVFLLWVELEATEAFLVWNILCYYQFDFVSLSVLFVELHDKQKVYAH